LQKKVLSSSGQSLATVSLIKVLFKEKYLSFCITPTYWSIEFKSILVKLILNLMLFCKTIKATPFFD
jgi:hypothetical protein